MFSELTASGEELEVGDAAQAAGKAGKLSRGDEES